MSSDAKFFDLYKSPEWQKMRLKVMERAGFSCENCGDGEKTLNVHHSYYEKGKKPWEYREESLYCLCETCHVAAEKVKSTIKNQFGRISLSSMEILAGFAVGLELWEDDAAIAYVCSAEFALGLGAIFGLNDDDVVPALKGGRITGRTLRAFQEAKK